MGDYADYCGSLDVRYLCQTQYDQLTEFTDDATFIAWMKGTLIPMCEKIIDSYVGHPFGTPSLGTFILDGSGKSSLFFPPKWTPLIGLSAGSIDSSAVNVDDLKIYDQYIRYSGGNFTEGKLNCVFYGSYGYLDKDRAPVVPDDIKYVCAQLGANVIVDMVRRNVTPDLFRQVLMTRTSEGARGLGSMWASPYLFTTELKDICDKYRILWADIG
jgi:hypothetical protein